MCDPYVKDEKTFRQDLPFCRRCLYKLRPKANKAFGDVGIFDRFGVLESLTVDYVMVDTARVSPVTLEEYGAMDMEGRRAVWLKISDITEEEFEAHMARERAREAMVPAVGTDAPDFVADVLGPNRQRSGEQVRLSDLRGKPVGIAFGSFT